MINNTYLTHKMLVQYVRLGSSTIYRLKSENKIPYRKIGKRLIYVKSEIDDWIMEHSTINLDIPFYPLNNKNHD
jgi:predicted DNA-binding transcriptional regulator AlpA